jgi:glycine cleavage system pyridoxal-binding protein P
VLAQSVEAVNRQLLANKIIGPLAVESRYPMLQRHALVCVTETTSRGEIEGLVSALRKVLSDHQG